MTSCNSLENLYYNIYDPITCSNTFNGYPKGGLSTETYPKERSVKNETCSRGSSRKSETYSTTNMPVIYEYLDRVPNPTNYDKCSHKTIYGASWESVLNFKWDTCKGVVYANKSGNFRIKGTASEPGILKYWASAPNTCTYSNAGKGLPFPNEEIAYENTPNKGEIKVGNNGKFEIHLMYPAGYYINGGEIYVPPHVNIKLCGSKENILNRILLPVELPFRSLGFNLANNSREWQPVPYKK
jgi:hypothetical protein